jgi:hypothetical protein
MEKTGCEAYISQKGWTRRKRIELLSSGWVNARPLNLTTTFWCAREFDIKLIIVAYGFLDRRWHFFGRNDFWFVVQFSIGTWADRDNGVLRGRWGSMCLRRGHTFIAPSLPWCIWDRSTGAVSSVVSFVIITYSLNRRSDQSLFFPSMRTTVLWRELTTGDRLFHFLFFLLYTTSCGPSSFALRNPRIQCLWRVEEQCSTLNRYWFSRREVSAAKRTRTVRPTLSN